jgi:hypothetical protein
MVSVVDSGFEPGRVKPKTIYNIGICCFSAKHTALRRKSKDGLVRNQNNVSEFYQSFAAHCPVTGQYAGKH